MNKWGWMDQEYEKNERHRWMSVAMEGYSMIAEEILIPIPQDAFINLSDPDFTPD